MTILAFAEQEVLVWPVANQRGILGGGTVHKFHVRASSLVAAYLRGRCPLSPSLQGMIDLQDRIARLGRPYLMKRCRT